MSSKSKIDRFREKFRADYREGHYHFACHAAFPVGFTVDMLYQLWANFKDLPQGSIDRLAVSDLLQSDLCRTTQRGIFEMELEVRNALLEDLRRLFGKEREQDLARFLYQYADDIQVEDIPVSFRDTQKMIALGTLAPNLAVERLAQQFNQQLDKGNRPEIYRMDSLLEALLKQDQAFENLRNLSKGIRGTMAGAELTEEEMADTFGKVIKINPSLSNIAEGVRIALPEHLREQVLAYRREISQDGEVEALRRIREARENAASKLDLSKLGLTGLPEELFGLSQLKTLDLYDNALTEIPVAIARLTNLEKLMASQNQLTTLPESLAELKELKTLKFDSNQLGVIPEVIFSLENLQDLSLENNGIEFLPPDIQNLSKLQLVDLRENPVYNIPQGRKKFTRGYLQELWSSEGVGSQKSAVVFLVQADEDEAMLEPIRNAIEREMIAAEILTFRTLDELYNRCRENAPLQGIVHLNFSNTNSGRLEVYLGESPVKLSVSAFQQLFAPLRSLRCLVNPQPLNEENAKEIVAGNILSILFSRGFSRGADTKSSIQAFYERLTNGSLVYAGEDEPVSPDYQLYITTEYGGIGGWSIPRYESEQQQRQQQQTATSEVGIDQFKREAMELITKDDLKQVFTLAQQSLTHESEIFDDFIFLEARFQRLNEDNFSGLLPVNLYDSELNEIRKSLLQAVQNITSDNYTTKPQNEPWDQPGDGQYGSLGALKFHLKKHLIDDLDMTFTKMERCLNASSKPRAEFQTLEQRLDVFNRQARGGLLDASSLIVRKNQIVKATIDLINQIEEEDLNTDILAGSDDANVAHPDPIEIFLSYAEADRSMVEILKKELIALNLSSAEVYDPRESIDKETSLEEAEKSIEDVLHEAEMVISIISPGYLESEYCQREMQIAARRADAGDSILIPVIYRNCDWQSVTALAQRQIIPSDGEPLNMVKDLDGAIFGVANQIGVKVGELVTERNRPPEDIARAAIMAMPDRPRIYLALQSANSRRISSQLSQVYLQYLSSQEVDWEVEQYANEEGLLSKLIAYRNKLVWLHLLRDDIYRSNTRKGEAGINYQKVLEQVLKAPFLKLIVLDQTANRQEVEMLLNAGIPAVMVCPEENNKDENSYLKDFYEKMANGIPLIQAWNETVAQYFSSRLEELHGMQSLNAAFQSSKRVTPLREGLYVSNQQISNWRLVPPTTTPPENELERLLREALLKLNFVRQKYSYEEKQGQIQHPITIVQGPQENAPELLVKNLIKGSIPEQGSQVILLDLSTILGTENWQLSLQQLLAPILGIKELDNSTMVLSVLAQKLETENLVLVIRQFQQLKTDDALRLLDELNVLFTEQLAKTPNRLLTYFLSEKSLSYLNKADNTNLIALPQISPLERPDIDYWLQEPAEKLPPDLQDRIRKEVEAYFRKEKSMPIVNFVELVIRLAERPQLAESLLKMVL